MNFGKRRSVELTLLFVGAIFGLCVCACILLIPAALQPPPEVRESFLLFDGVCNLCDGFVNFVADHDPDRLIKFGAIQRHRDLMVAHGAGRFAEGGSEALTTVVLIQGGQVYTQSSAALRTLALLEAPWNSASALYGIPGPVRNLGYSLVARYRYLLFGRSHTCRPPTEAFKARFIEHRTEQKPSFHAFGTN